MHAQRCTPQFADPGETVLAALCIRCLNDRRRDLGAAAAYRARLCRRRILPELLAIPLYAGVALLAVGVVAVILLQVVWGLCVLACRRLDRGITGLLYGDGERRMRALSLVLVLATALSLLAWVARAQW